MNSDVDVDGTLEILSNFASRPGEHAPGLHAESTDSM
jgi:hypothetical protein